MVEDTLIEDRLTGTIIYQGLSDGRWRKFLMVRGEPVIYETYGEWAKSMFKSIEE